MIAEFRVLGIAKLEEITDLYAINSAFVNLFYTLPSEQVIRFGDDSRIYLGNQICFPLYACSREIIKQYNPFLDQIDLTYTQYITMMVLWG